MYCPKKEGRKRGNEMNIGISVGHSILVSGECTAADGSELGGGNEYEFCLKLAPAIKSQLEEAGHTATVLRVPERTVMDLAEERRYKMKQYNEQNFDIVLELHLNESSRPRAEGTETLYVSEEGKKYAEAILQKLRKEGGEGIWKGRNAKRRADIAFLNDTKAIAVQIELFFCTNKSEWKRGQKNRKKIAKLITEAIESVG